MSQTYLVPLLCTRGVIIFPTQEVNIDVGRSESIKACEYANNNNSYSNTDSADLSNLLYQKDVKRRSVVS